LDNAFNDADNYRSKFQPFREFYAVNEELDVEKLRMEDHGINSVQLKPHIAVFTLIMSIMNLTYTTALFFSRCCLLSYVVRAVSPAAYPVQGLSY